jgi:hypothetical protein
VQYTRLNLSRDNVCQREKNLFSAPVLNNGMQLRLKGTLEKNLQDTKEG